MSKRKGKVNGAAVPAPRILWRKDLAQRYGCDPLTITRYHRDGIIPAGRFLPKKSRPFWYEHEIIANEQNNLRLTRRLAKASAVPVPSPNQFHFQF